jgi:hypothetical protein
MTVLSSFAEAATFLADAVDPLDAASITELRDAIVIKCRAVTIHTPPEQIIALVNLTEDLETLLDRLSAEHHAVTSINTVAA